MKFANRYYSKLSKALKLLPLANIEKLAKILKFYRDNGGRKVFICGNGGSAANSNHAETDFIYVGRKKKKFLNCESLCGNSSVITCLANDIGYENIFSYQLRVKAKKNDILIVLSGSGNSKNILNALKEGKKIGMKTFAILGYNGGAAKKISQNVINTPINDMQVSEDIQMIIIHSLIKYLIK